MKKTYKTPDLRTIFYFEVASAIMATSTKADGDNTLGGGGTGAADDRKDETITGGDGDALSKGAISFWGDED